MPQAGHVKLGILNVKGQKIKTLIDTELEAGQHRTIWSGVDNLNRSVASGVYFVRIETAGQVSVKK